MDGMAPHDMRALVHRHIETGFNRGDWTVCQSTLGWFRQLGKYAD